jgi:hypothetical protein
MYEHLQGADEEGRDRGEARRDTLRGAVRRGSRSFGFVLFLTLAFTGAGSPASSGGAGLIGLTGDNRLALFDAARPGEVRYVKVTGVSGPLLGIDFRPADGKLYGVTSTNDLYTIEPATGAATLLATLTVAFDAGARCGFDFNPQTDRLRLVGANGQNLRAHARLGAAAFDAPLTYGARDRNAGKRPKITAAAYTNSVKAAPATLLFEIDSELDVLVLQDPPNDGILKTVGPLGVDAGPLAGFDIITDAPGRERAFAAFGSVLYAIDLKTGAATQLDAIGDGKLTLIGLAVRPAAAK